MSDKDLESLCCLLNLMPARVVASLNETEIWWLPDLTGAKKRQAIVSIRLALRAFESPENRVFCIAWLYCCLAQRGRLRPWLPYIADATGTAWKGKFVLHERLAEALQSAGSHTTCVKVEILNRIYSCVMAKSLEGDQDEYDVICLCVMPPLPQIFVHATRNASAVVAILQTLLRGNPCQMAKDVIGEMRFAFASDAQGERETNMRNVSSASDELCLISKTADPGDRAVEPGQHSSESEEIIVDDVFAVPVTSPRNPDGSLPSSGGVARFLDLREADCSFRFSGKGEEELDLEGVEFRGLSPEKTARKY